MTNLLAAELEPGPSMVKQAEIIKVSKNDRQPNI